MELISSVNFEPVGNVTNVFFDDKNQQVFSVRSGGATGILVRGSTEQLCSTFRAEDKGSIFSIKLSPDQKILAIQRSKIAVQFVGVVRLGPNGSLDESGEYTQSSKGKNNTILGFAWSGNNEILFITDTGIELYSVIPERKLLKNIRNQTQSINWFTFCPRTSILIVSPTISTNIIQLYLIKGSYIHKLPKIESDPNASTIREKDVFITTLYGSSTYIGIFSHSKSNGSDINLYNLSKDNTTITKSHILKLGGLQGPFSVNVVDYLITVHHLNTACSFIFDIALPGEFDGTVLRHNTVTNNSISINDHYSKNWATFQPDIIVDAKIGTMWKVRLKLKNLLPEINDLTKLAGFLLQREGAKMILLDVLFERVREPDIDLATIGSVFDLVNKEYRCHLEHQMQVNLALPVTLSTFRVTPSSSAISSVPSQSPAKVILDQSDMYTNLFSRFTSSAPEDEIHGCSDNSRQINLLLEYFRSLNEFKIPIQQYFNELLINYLVQENRWYQLHQLLQYRVISDSKPLSCLLLSLENVYKPAGQLALDMLSRLGSATDEICEILLSKKMILPALKYVTHNGLDSIPARKFLAISVEMEDKLIFYSVYKYFEQRNLQLRGTKKFTPSDRCQTYVDKFYELFPNDDIDTSY